MEIQFGSIEHTSAKSKLFQQSPAGDAASQLRVFPRLPQTRAAAPTVLTFKDLATWLSLRIPTSTRTLVNRRRMHNTCRSPAEISRVVVRLPPFWVDRPAVWFAQAGAQFNWACINNEEPIFYHVIYQLDHHLSTAKVLLHLAKDRDDETAVLLKRTAHSPVSHARDGRP